MIGGYAFAPLSAPGLRERDNCINFQFLGKHPGPSHVSQLSLALPDTGFPAPHARPARIRAAPRLAAQPAMSQQPCLIAHDPIDPTPIQAPGPMQRTDPSAPTSSSESAPDAPIAAIREDRLWHDNGWTARVIKNEDDDGWAVEMLKDGEPEPALVGPWTMGRDKKNPKPLDQAAFNTLVKTATEVLQRHAQQAHAVLHKRLTVFALERQWEIRLDITPDEYEPFATLSAFDEAGEEVAQVRVRPDFRLTNASATGWIAGGFPRLGRDED